MKHRDWNLYADPELIAVHDNFDREPAPPIMAGFSRVEAAAREATFPILQHVRHEAHKTRSRAERDRWTNRHRERPAQRGIPARARVETPIERRRNSPPGPQPLAAAMPF